MSTHSIVGGRVFVGESGFQQLNIHIEGEQITDLTNDFRDNSSTIKLDDDDIVLPGRIDGHIHGAAGFDVMDATIEAIEGIASALVKEGTTSFLPTTMTAGQEKIENALQTINDYQQFHNNREKAEVIGIHLEGPFISTNKIGAQNPKYIQMPNFELFQKWYQISGSNIKVVTLAPEIKGATSFIKHLTKNGVVVSIGHSNATYAQVKAALSAGASQFTHLYNAMRPLHHREPGVVGGAFLNQDALAELIVDGLHCAPEMVKLAFDIKGKQGLMLITDAMRAKCLGNGTYELGGLEVYVQEGKATLKDGTLAGSILTMQDACWNMMNYTNANIDDLVFMNSINPAKQYGVYNRKGSINIGKDADLIILDSNYELKMTICRGEIAYEKRC
ncbi:N-acetylglucosamine-6-phosphate deacetylase [Pseudalkalibacillus berkeleyi]|uniref:N-acetylglucosamine-6-phosphate deacetylase n=1 Tax=Pseudalkalibacillus berkeleyi TaxID=1069813 RepID=A0ABS9GYE8_9BACL|nr:N-acetylglucosamine-6-phosphate deacetylase [Pseudalkalibacillus berkeleyi]MCF6137773.1 N-acetylglucosamine-6-phosphate deacetylase [Pseudalkalibacillus berkeleyi]